MANFYDMFYTLNQWGITDILLPFFLVFTVVFAVFQKMGILGADSKKFHIVIALATAFAVVMPHLTGRGPDVIPIINNSLPAVAAVSIAVLMALYLIGVFGFKFKMEGYMGLVATVSILVVFYIFGVSANWFPQWGLFDNFLDSDTQALVIAILVIGLVISFIAKDSSNNNEGGFIKNLNKMFEKLGGNNG